MSKLLEFKVKVTAISCKGNRVAKLGEKVSEKELATPWTQLVDGGYIEPTKKSKALIDAAAKESAKGDEEKAAAEAAAKEAFDAAYDAGELSAEQLDTLSKAKIAKYAKDKLEKEVDHNKFNKADLITEVLRKDE